MKLPVMQFTLDNATIVDAVKAAVEAGGVSLEGKYVQIEFKTKRKGPDAGLSAAVSISSTPFLASTDDTAGKSVSDKPATEAADTVAEEVAAEAKTETTSNKKTASKKADLFNETE
ncbi:MAG: hypothetical protein CMC55_06605 [Flavobacteriaceae bacterium]|nr:hypothetical protein [Flavobacteriaceae bacterium]